MLQRIKCFKFFQPLFLFFFFFGCNLVFDLVLFYEFMSVAPRPESQSLLSSGDREYTGTIDLQRYTLSQIFLDFLYCTLYVLYIQNEVYFLIFAQDPQVLRSSITNIYNMYCIHAIYHT